MKKLYLTFLWHMHQPYYKDDSTGSYYLPWVFLHGIKDYLELPRYYEIYNLKSVFNLVPSLIEQIIDLTNNFMQDILIEKISKPVLTLSEDEKLYLLKPLFWANETNMIKPSKRYYELYLKYKSGEFSNITHSELLDLEVHFLLAWTGTFIRYESSFIKALIQKDRGYFEDEKQKLLEILFNKFKYILEYYNKLSNEGKIELSTTPFYHPILPLLIDPHCFNEALPYVSIPENAISMEDDALWHLKEAVAFYGKTFGDKPSGIWPAEGSVSNKTLDLFCKHGIRWTATDEDILGKSLGVDIKNRSNRLFLYQKYYYESVDDKIYIFFRDKELSDLIGFVYSRMDAESATDDFINRLKDIYEISNFSPHVSVILDGENAWEFYKNNGRDFFDRLFEKISHTEWIKTLTYSEVIEDRNIDENRLNNIFSGSWINGNFSTWMGHPEKNKAWYYLYQIKNIFNWKKGSLNSDQINKVSRELHIAEGSDWFWWYGDDHFTEQADVLDNLFRVHLKNAYEHMGLSYPSDLEIPIKVVQRKVIIKEPKGEIYTNFDGKIDSIFEYMGAGEIDIKFDMSTMHTDATYLKRMKWGVSDQFLYIILIGNLANLKNSKEDIILNIKENNLNEDISIDLLNGRIISNGQVLQLIEYRFNEYIELLFKVVEDDFIETVDIYFELYKGNHIIDRAPVYSSFTIDIFKRNMNLWIV